MSNETEFTEVHTKATSAPVEVRRSKRPDPSGNGFVRFLRFLGWVFSGFGLLPALFRGGGQGPERKQEITIYCAHRAFNLWALVVVGFVGAWVVHRWVPQGHWEDSTNRVALVLGWIYIWTLAYTFVTLLFDFGALKLALWIGVILLLWVASNYIEAIHQVPVLSAVFGHMRALHPKLDPGFATVMAYLMLVPWVGALFLTFTNGRKRFTPNEITEWYIGEGSELLDRSGLKFRTRYRDVLEMVLGFGAGDLIAFDNRGNVIKKFENILFLIFLWPKLDALLQERQTIVDTAPGDTLEVASHPHHGRDPTGGVVVVEKETT